MNTIKFKNIYGAEINNTQATMSKEYLKEFYIDNILKKIERIENDITDITYYYLSNQESINELLPLFQAKKVSFINESNVTNYILQDVYFYVNGILNGRSKSVLNDQNKIICYQRIDISTGTPIHNDSRKYYYENNESKYTFEYDANGDCFIIYDDTTDQQDIFAWDIGTSNTSFTWTGFEYYQFATPIIPTNPIA